MTTAFPNPPCWIRAVARCSSDHMSSGRRGAVVGALLSALVVWSAGAQCPDGTPPPCTRGVARPAATSLPPAERERARTFLVLPFRNLSRRADYQWLVEGSPTMLADVLGQWTELTVVPDERLYPALRRHELQPGNVMDLARLRRVAAETGGGAAGARGGIIIGGPPPRRGRAPRPGAPRPGGPSAF